MSSNTAEKLDEVEKVQSIEPDLSITELDDVSGPEEIGKPSPIPKGIKFLLAGLAVLIIVVVASVFLFTGDDYEPVVTSSAFVDPISLANGKKIAQASNDGFIKDSQSTTEDVPPDANVTTTKEEFITKESPIQSIEVVAANVSEDFNSLKSLLDEQGLDINQMNETVSQLKNEEFAQFRQQITAVSEELEKIRNLVNKQYAELKNNKKRESLNVNRPPVKPPFALVSIDVWGNQENAVILMQGKTSFAQLGEERAGWKIVRFSRPDCIVTESISSNKQVKLCKKA